MRAAAEVFSTIFLSTLIFLVTVIFAFGAGVPAQTLNLPEAVTGVSVDDDYVPDVTARVARISFIGGDAKIRRSETEQWENAALNLPVVEGDEIVTELGGRIEIQFDKFQHLRLSESSYLKIVNLKDEGIAVSLSLGTLSLTITSFNKDRVYFEIDAPRTTLAVQRAGAYRVDAGKEGDAEVRVAATEGGEARLYSDNAGFTLKNGRSARIFIDGATSGEWETAEASRYSDDFDEWVSDRDSAIAKRLKDAYYDKYYDNDIYGADDLNDYGEWVNTRSYGYVWRPLRTSLSRYADWSPYRYGHWRWMPPYGWIWVNDEPWGWATYHHGRWFYDNGYWNWSPYGYYRNTRSWWFPALVVINIFNNNVCWYPLPYNYTYYNYNRNYNAHRGRRRNPGNNGGGPTATPTPTGPTAGQINEERRRRSRTPPLANVPPGGVVTVTNGEFGNGRRGIRRATIDVARTVLSKVPDAGETPPILPTFEDVKSKMGREIRVEKPRITPMDTGITTGAATRKTDAPLDQELRNSRIFGNRPPLTTTIEQGGVRTTNKGPSDSRKTGAVDRPPVVKQDRNETPVNQTPVNTPSIIVREEPRNPPVKTPRYDPPPTKHPPRYDPPPKQETPRYDPPPTRQPPRSDPPPTRNEPKQESKPSKPPESSSKNKKDGR